MKKLFLILIYIIIPIYIYAHDEVHKVVVLKDWKPYYFVNSDNKPDGYAIELFDAVANVTKIKYKYVLVNNFKEAIELIEKKEADIIPNIGITQNRENLFLFTQETDSFLINIYKRKEIKTINSYKDLKSKTIGIVKTNVCNKLINTNEIKKKIYFNNLENMIEALNQNKIDAFCYPRPLVDSKVDTSKIVHLPNAIKEIKRGIGVAKDEFHLLSQLNDGITKIKLSGKYEKIHNKWFLENDYIQLSKSETFFIVGSFIGVSFTALIIIFYILSKKKWLITKDMLEDEIERKTSILKLQNKRLKIIHERLKEQNYIDPLTKIHNRKYYNEKIIELLSLFDRYEDIFTFVIFDIDDFKSINDTYGHQKGDEVLIQLTSLVKTQIRSNDYFCRIGGEEFVLLLSQTPKDEAYNAVLKIKDLIENKVDCLKNRKVTVSIGLSEVRKDDTEESIYKRADTLLYLAKNNGKNRIEI